LAIAPFRKRPCAPYDIRIRPILPARSSKGGALDEEFFGGSLEYGWINSSWLLKNSFL